MIVRTIVRNYVHTFVRNYVRAIDCGDDVIGELAKFLPEFFNKQQWLLVHLFDAWIWYNPHQCDGDINRMSDPYMPLTGDYCK